MRRPLIAFAFFSTALGCQTAVQKSVFNDTLRAPKIKFESPLILTADDSSSSFIVNKNLHLDTNPNSHIFCDDSIYAAYLKNRFIASASLNQKFSGRRSYRQQEIARKSLDNEATHSARAQLNPPMFNVQVTGVPVEYNASVEKWLNYYTGPGRKSFLTWLVRAEAMKKLIVPVLKENGMPAEMTNMAMIESGFNANAYSRARATGTWQFMSGTAKNYDLELNHWLDERRDPVKSTVAAAKYLRDLYRDFGNWYLAFAAYNAGPGKIRRALKASGGTSFWDIAKTRHIRLETKEYVPKFLAAYLISQNPEHFGFNVGGDPTIEMPTGFVHVPRPIRLSDLAAGINIPVQTIKRWNPELKSDITPPKKGGKYLLRIPEHKKEVVANLLPKLPQIHIRDVKMHTIRRGDTLIRLARQYGVSRQLIASLNNSVPANRLIVGRQIAIPVPSVEVIQ